MKKFVCQYAIVRFLPYLETGEFANAGIVLLCPETGYFDFRLLNRVRRITAFFEELHANIYRDTQKSFIQELKRIKTFIAEESNQGKLGKELVGHIFAELTRPREVMMRFDNIRSILTDDPAQQLDELFSYYVERDFATAPYLEKLLEKDVRNILKGANLINQYKAQTLGDKNAYHANFPFVYMEDNIVRKAIKPLSLAHDDPALIFDHGWAWLGKIRQLREMHLLHDDVLLPVKQPLINDGAQMDMYRKVIKKLIDDGIDVVQAHETERIVQFAMH